MGLVDYLKCFGCACLLLPFGVIAFSRHFGLDSMHWIDAIVAVVVEIGKILVAALGLLWLFVEIVSAALGNLIFRLFGG